MLDRGLWAIVPRQRAVEVHAVDEQPVVGGEVLEPGPGVAVGDPLGDVDVHADAELGRQLGGRSQRLVAARERGVHTDHPSPAGAQVPLVLGQAARWPRSTRDGRSRRTRRLTRTPTSAQASAMIDKLNRRSPMGSRGGR